MEKANPEFNWGVRFNQRPYWAADDPPIWARKAEQEKWGKPGLVLWDDETETLAHLTATQALHILDSLVENEAWRQGEIALGEPATRISLDEPGRGPERILTHKIYLTPDRTRTLLELLQRVQPDLEIMRKAEEDERARILGEIFSYVLSDSWGREKAEEGDPIPETTENS